jgi:CheY-like chemotaxis protein
VLLVDDSAVVLMMEQMILSRAPYEVQVARSGEEALELAGRERPDLVLLDVTMPGLSGLETVRRLRARSETRSVPVVLVTAREDARTIEDGFASGCDDYLVKPIRGPELLEKVQRLLAGVP